MHTDYSCILLRLVVLRFQIFKLANDTLSVYDLTEYHMLSIEVWRWHSSHKKLGSVGACEYSIQYLGAMVISGSRSKSTNLVRHWPLRAGKASRVLI